jgi:hypothetical protein|tara:strand:- start:389 stop:691 length:303 start_codon:yes stop_codon:yes gene_type:complete
MGRNLLNRKKRITVKKGARVNSAMDMSVVELYIVQKLKKKATEENRTRRLHISTCQLWLKWRPNWRRKEILIRVFDIANPKTREIRIAIYSKRLMLVKAE